MEVWFDLSLGCDLAVVMLCRLPRDVSAPQRLADQTVGHQHHQQREHVDQHYHCKLVTTEGEREKEKERERKREREKERVRWKLI